MPISGYLVPNLVNLNHFKTYRANNYPNENSDLYWLLYVDFFVLASIKLLSTSEDGLS